MLIRVPRCPNELYTAASGIHIFSLLVEEVGHHGPVADEAPYLDGAHVTANADERGHGSS
jgi:hypothetical protein